MTQEAITPSWQTRQQEAADVLKEIHDATEAVSTFEIQPAVRAREELAKLIKIDEQIKTLTDLYEEAKRYLRHAERLEARANRAREQAGVLSAQSIEVRDLANLLKSTVANKLTIAEHQRELSMIIARRFASDIQQVSGPKMDNPGNQIGRVVNLDTNSEGDDVPDLPGSPAGYPSNSGLAPEKIGPYTPEPFIGGSPGSR